MKKLVFKFNYSQFEGIYKIIRAQMMQPVNSQDFVTRLYLYELAKLGKRIHSKMYFNVREQYSFSFTLAESLAFFCYFNPLLSQISGDFERAMLTGICSEIHQQLI